MYVHVCQKASGVFSAGTHTSLGSESTVSLVFSSEIQQMNVARYSTYPYRSRSPYLLTSENTEIRICTI